MALHARIRLGTATEMEAFVFQHMTRRRAYMPTNARIQRGRGMQGHLSMISISSVWRLLSTATINLAIPNGGGITRLPIRNFFLHTLNIQGKWAYLVIIRLKYSRVGRQWVYVSRIRPWKPFSPRPLLYHFPHAVHLHFQNNRLPSHGRKLLDWFRLPKHCRPRWGATLRLYHYTQFYHKRHSKLRVDESQARIELGAHAR